MTKVWGTMREFLPMAAIILLCMLFMPVAQAHAENNGTSANNGTASATTAVTPQQQNTAIVTADQKTATPTSKAKVAATKPRDKSVLDAEVLESPLDYFRNAFGSEEEESDAAKAGAVIITVKALVATLLSTVM